MKLQTHYLDVGNYSILSLTERQQRPTVIRSVRSELIGTRPREPRTTESPLVVYSDGSKIHWGTTAYKYRNFNITALGDKTELLVKALLATIPTSGTYKLRWTLPDIDRVDVDGLLNVINGKHQYTINGQDVTTELIAEQQEYEGVPAIRLARSKGWIEKTGYTLCIDLGGGTVNALVVDDGNCVIDNVSFEALGCVSIANDIAQNTVVVARCGTQLDQAYIMDGIADGSNCYCGKPEKHWKDYLDGYVDNWYKRVMEQVVSRFNMHMPRVTGILFIGGTANLLHKRLEGKPMIHTPKHPEFANIAGLRA